MLAVWRHPKPIGASGRCIGHTDLPVDPRKAKRLAHRIRRHARKHGLPREVWTSSLRRAADVGGWLARWGWQHRIEPTLAEADFGAWDGLRWDDIGEPAVAAWCADFAAFDAHGGESVAALFARCAGSLRAMSQRVAGCVVAHAGWINAARRLSAGQGVPSAASDWPVVVGYSSRVALRVPMATQLGPTAMSSTPATPATSPPSAPRP
jgi:alpha-ribazole phosphatase